MYFGISTVLFHNVSIVEICVYAKVKQGSNCGRSFLKGVIKYPGKFKIVYQTMG